MEVLAVVLVMIGIIAVRVISFFYPDWKAVKGEYLSERKHLGYSVLGIDLLLVMFILSQFILRI
ncbi:hypothetical protein JF544_14070 [Halobacillus kuroshimensis]|uniref:Uncharacterized protein n=1 Tax=Halobacillus kuroshimensis TaxID=302481 RepID=A0ABS3DYF5_9BACI|nr:hypothetical protein [Halobacillus kuroshimensis]MBN8236390.1 hypothetical protein [Halobacillus kuroshimensis]